jgi:selenide,water dikinase
VLFLTKPIGSGVLATAHKRKIINETHYNTLVETTIQLNRVGEILGEAHYVNSITDVTGFGLLGHLTEMAKASNLCAEINYNKIPLLEGVEHYLEQFIYPDNTTRNLNAYKPTTNGMNGLEFLTLCDPQTNGGLIISVSKDYVSEFRDLMKESKQKVFEIGIMKDTKDEIFVELI